MNKSLILRFIFVPFALHLRFTYLGFALDTRSIIPSFALDQSPRRDSLSGHESGDTLSFKLHPSQFELLHMAKKKPASKATTKSVETITHAEDKRKNIPTIEYRSMVREDQQTPISVRYPRNTDLDPQLMWRGKDEQDW